MKIYLSKYWRRSSLFILCLIMLLVVGLVFFCIWSNDRENYIMVLCVAWFVFILACILLCSKRFLTYAIIENHQIHSYSLFSKKLCTIITTKPTYYAFFSSSQGVSNKKFIVISNAPFEYQATYGTAKVKFIQHYDMAKQVVLPFNYQVAQQLNIDDWHNVLNKE